MSTKAKSPQAGKHAKIYEARSNESIFKSLLAAEKVNSELNGEEPNHKEVAEDVSSKRERVAEENEESGGTAEKNEEGLEKSTRENIAG